MNTASGYKTKVLKAIVYINEPKSGIEDSEEAINEKTLPKIWKYTSAKVEREIVTYCGSKYSNY